jgi:acyl dehydratase
MGGSGRSDRWLGPALAASRGWWLDDALPGQIIRHPGGRTITEAEHVWLAWVTHNVSDVHGDAAAAARSEWGQPLVLGMLTAAMVIGLAQPGTPPPELAALGCRDGWQSIRLLGTVVAGDTLSAESEILGVSPATDAASGRVRRIIRGYDQRGEVVVAIEEDRDIPRRPPADTTG